MNEFFEGIFEKTWLWVLVFFVFFEPDLIKGLGSIHKVFNLARLLIFLALAYYHYKKRPPLGRFSILVLIYYGLLLIITLFKGQSYTTVISTGLPVISMIIILELLLKKNPLMATRAIIFALSIMIYFNLAFRVIFPQGYLKILYPTTTKVRHVLGNTNQFISFIFPAISLSVFYSHLQGRKFTTNCLLLMVASTATLLIVKSVTSLVGLGLLLMYSFFIYGSKLERLVKIQILIPLYLGLFFLIVVFRKQALFGFFIRNILGKDLTFTKRTGIWDQALEKIKDSLLFGYGQNKNNLYITLKLKTHRNAHNIILQTLLRGGLVALVALATIVGQSLRSLKEDQGSMARYFVVVIFLYFIMMLVEIYPLSSVFLILLYGAKQGEIREELKRGPNHARQA